jgi:hypothetical protein
VELPERLLALLAAAGPVTRVHGGVPPGALVRSVLSIARSEPDLELVDLIPLRFGPLPLRYREELLQALAGGNRLRFVHGGIISRRRVFLCANR